MTGSNTPPLLTTRLRIYYNIFFVFFFLVFMLLLHITSTVYLYCTV